MNRIAELGEFIFGNLMAMRQGLSTVPIVSSPQQRMIRNDDHRRIGGREKWLPETFKTLRQCWKRGLGRRLVLRKLPDQKGTQDHAGPGECQHEPDMPSRPHSWHIR